MVPKRLDMFPLEASAADGKGAVAGAVVVMAVVVVLLPDGGCCPAALMPVRAAVLANRSRRSLLGLSLMDTPSVL